jgi:hypothetical protein
MTVTSTDLPAYTKLTVYPWTANTYFLFFVSPITKQPTKVCQQAPAPFSANLPTATESEAPT